jgi:hypothetical protein
MDDNIIKFARFNNNLIIQVNDGTIFRCMEDFCESKLSYGKSYTCYDDFANDLKADTILKELNCHKMKHSAYRK